MNPFSKVMVKKTDKELNDILNKSSMYTIDALNAVKAELDIRASKGKNEDRIQSENRTNDKGLIIEPDEKINFEPYIPIEIEENLEESAIRLYSKQAVFVFSMLASPVFGAILFSMNLKTIHKEKYIIPVIGSSLLYFALTMLVFNFLPNEYYEQVSTPVSFGINSLGGATLQGLVWTKCIGKDYSYSKRNVLAPSLILIGMIILFMIILIKFNVPV